jgi:hypothetical protein
MGTFSGNLLRQLRVCAAVLVLLAGVTAARADAAPFDLAGPKLDITVTRLGTTLPIAEVPNLAAGDVLTIKTDFPQGQSAHYLMIAAFLRGSTNPPPESWFFKSETWNRKDKNGLTLTVPDGAQQVLVFLAPETGGDYRTLMNAVRGRPGAFVRASQDLLQASLDRSRLDTYLADVRAINSEDPSKLKDTAPILGRSLGISIDPKCFDKETEQQSPCLMQNQDAIILNDGHSTSIVQALTSGPASDLAIQASYTPEAAYGQYSPYVASVIDIARILDSLHTAQYQYIPALARLKDDEMALVLNTPPSFHNPKSVLVIALPAVEDPQPPPLHAVNPKEVYCAEKSSVALGVDGAPLIFSTSYAHDIVLRVTGKDGKTVDVPVKPDAAKGGLVIDSASLKPDQLGKSVSGSLHGQWGFARFDGPEFHLTNDPTPHWELAAGDHQSLVVGRDDLVHLQGGEAGCMDSITLAGPDGTEKKAEWKMSKADEIEVKLPLSDAKPGDVSLKIKDYGSSAPQTIALRAFDEPGHLESFVVHAGDSQGILKGTRLDETAKVVLAGVEFVPAKLTSSNGSDELEMVAKDANAVADLRAGQATKADVTLKDGREIHLDVTVGAARPSAMLLGKSIDLHGEKASLGEGRIQLANADELPEDAKLTFSVRAQKPTTFSRDVTIEVATEDDAVTTTLSTKDGTLTREDRSVAVARLNPAKAFGGSAFGPLRFRVVENGVGSDWQPLATLVRLPELHGLQCPPRADQSCQLTGGDLFLLDSVASDAAFQHAVQVQDGFPGQEIDVPHPVDGQLFVKLRDDPTVVNRTAFAGAVSRITPPAAPAVVTPAPAAPVSGAPASSAPAAVPSSPPAVASPQPAAIKNPA